ncbi:MAG: hypothetical protein L0H93_07345 [Nocardioides sp.]|nr:hypothetical protein [Nocardioides sp.]
MSLPFGTRLLHIGPHKTGTTTLQAAMHGNRPLLAEQGVHYVGAKKHSMTAVMAAASGVRHETESADVGQREWHDLVAEANGSDARVAVLSSEFFSEAPEDRIDGILEALGKARTHVVVTVRSLMRILPSQWQQYMQNGAPMGYDSDMGYEAWLDVILNHKDPSVTPTFWQRHRHDRLVMKWAATVGPDRLTVVVVDEHVPDMLVRSFEQFLDLRAGSLNPPEVAANRSLTFAEIQLLRAFNSAWISRDFSSSDYAYLVRFGAARFLQRRTPAPDEIRLLTPEWAVARAAELGAEMAEAIAATGVHVVGDLNALSDVSLAKDVGQNASDEPVPVTLAARFSAGLIERLDHLPAAEPSADRAAGPLEMRTRRYKLARKWEPQSVARRRIDRVQAQLDGVRRVEDLGRRELLQEALLRARAALRSG